MRCLAQTGEAANGDVETVRVRSHGCVPNAQRLGFDAEEVCVKGAMVGRAHHETIPRIIGPVIGHWHQMRSVEDVQHPDVTKRTRGTVAAEHIESKACLPHPLRARPDTLGGRLNSRKRGLIIRQLLGLRRFLAKDNQELARVVVPLLYPPEPDLSKSRTCGSARDDKHRDP